MTFKTIKESILQFDKLLCEIDSMISYDNHKPIIDSSDSETSDSETSIKTGDIKLLDEYSDEN